MLQKQIQLNGCGLVAEGGRTKVGSASPFFVGVSLDKPGLDGDGIGALVDPGLDGKTIFTFCTPSPERIFPARN